MALLQPAPEVYELFDNILLMAEGHVIFHGPKEDVLPFFEGLGFKLPARKGIGDFLQEVTIMNSSCKTNYVTSRAAACCNWAPQSLRLSQTMQAGAPNKKSPSPGPFLIEEEPHFPGWESY